ncbi:MAG: NUDIX domain-containing protein [Bacteroidota bacterium]
MEEGVCYMTFDSPRSLKMAISTLENNSIADKFIIAHDNLPELFACFSSLFRNISAAGGLVRNPGGDCLLILRHGKWDLPKGKMEKGEEPQAAALREVSEECGLGELTVIRPLPDTYHVYIQNGEHILKTTHWYEMMCSDTRQPVPQLEEGITEVKWTDKSRARRLLCDSYASLRDLALKVL